MFKNCIRVSIEYRHSIYVCDNIDATGLSSNSSTVCKQKAGVNVRGACVLFVFCRYHAVKSVAVPEFKFRAQPPDIVR